MRRKARHSRPPGPGFRLGGGPGLVAPLRGLCSPCQAAALLVRSTMKRVSRYLLVGKARKRPKWVNLGNSGAVIMNLLIWRIVGRASAPAQRRPLPSAVLTVGPAFRHESLPPEVALLLPTRSEEHTSELQSLMRTSYAVFC